MKAIRAHEIGGPEVLKLEDIQAFVLFQMVKMVLNFLRIVAHQTYK